MEGILAEYGPLGLVMLGMFFWFQNRVAANRRLVEKAQADVNEHKVNCVERYEESAKQTATLVTTLKTMSETVKNIDRRTQDTHDRVTRIEARAG